MVIKFTSNVVDPPVLLYMGVDKYENEELIKYGWPEDVWFHVDKVSSAHVYLRLPPGMTIDTIPQALIDDCCQLVKANSIEGNKMNDVGIVYTMWENLKKTGDMAVGQIGFHDNKKVKRCVVAKRINDIVNRLNKTERKADIDYRTAKLELLCSYENNPCSKLVNSPSILQTTSVYNFISASAKMKFICRCV
ncbi:hypothetical protein RB195_019330 [Necator americanus]|uniref:Coiled-coil domain-containing protein 25 n=1 Tax=Necator americanus TaxID=51031 RepID=A0ABR1CFN7_NECAM